VKLPSLEVAAKRRVVNAVPVGGDAVEVVALVSLKGRVSADVMGTIDATLVEVVASGLLGGAGADESLVRIVVSHDRSRPGGSCHHDFVGAQEDIVLPQVFGQAQRGSNHVATTTGTRPRSSWM